MHNKVELTKMTYALQSLMSKALMDEFAISPECNVAAANFFGDLAITIKQNIFGEQVLYEEVEYPRDWWQAFKDRWLPEWAKRKWPVIYTKKIFDARFLYPSIKSPNYKAYLVTEARELSVAWNDETNDEIGSEQLK